MNPGALFGLFWDSRRELWASTAAHLELVLEAIVLALLVGIPAAVAASRSRGAERVALGLANTLQTVPSLALLGLLLIAFGGQIGKGPALAALVVYALLPIIKNTLIGLRGIDPSLLEASKAMGMTGPQRLAMVELPLAVPVILGGVRLATVASIGMATIAALIGARSLGTFIFRGITLGRPSLILLGAIPTALLALASDAALGELERRLDPRRTERSGWRALPVAAIILTLLATAAWGAWQEYGPARAGSQGVVRIGSKDATEAILLGHMLAELVEDRTGFAADRRFNLGGTLVCYNALAGGGLDVYVEYTGTALTTILGRPPDNDPEAVRERVRAGCLERDGVRMLDPLGFENTFAVLMRREQAERLGVRTLSDLARVAGRIRPGFGYEFMNRADGYPGLVRAYGLEFGTPPREMDRNLLYEAVARGALDVAAGDSTDGRIAGLDLVVLEDDRRYFPPYEAVPLARDVLLAEHPALAEALGLLAGRIDAATMRRLNLEVDGEGREPATVARKFLSQAGLLSAGR